MTFCWLVTSLPMYLKSRAVRTDHKNKRRLSKLFIDFFFFFWYFGNLMNRHLNDPVVFFNQTNFNLQFCNTDNGFMCLNVFLAPIIWIVSGKKSWTKLQKLQRLLHVKSSIFSIWMQAFLKHLKSNLKIHLNFRQPRFWLKPHLHQQQNRKPLKSCYSCN